MNQGQKRLEISLKISEVRRYKKKKMDQPKQLPEQGEIGGSGAISNGVWRVPSLLGGWVAAGAGLKTAEQKDHRR